MSTKNHIIGVRVDDATWERLERYESITGNEKVALARTALLAALEFFEARKSIKFPIKVVEAEVSWPPIGDEKNPQTGNVRVVRAKTKL